MPAKSIINAAIKGALSSLDEYRVAAVLFKGGAVIRVAANSNKFLGYRKEYFEFEPTRHAEMAVCHNMPKDVLKGCNMLVVRVDKKGSLVSAKPCRACFQVIKEAEISRVYYSNYDGEIVKYNPGKVEISDWDKERKITQEGPELA